MVIFNLIKERGDIVSIDVVPEWMINLDDEEMAKQYEVTYPTVRLRLDKLIQKIKISETTNNEPYIALIKRLAVNEKIDFDTAKILMSEYKKTKKEIA